MDVRKRLYLFERDLEASLRKRDFPSPAFCRGVLGMCDVVIVDDPERALRLSEIARRVAEMLDDPHLRGRSHQARGAALRALSRFGEAAEAYDTAGKLAYECPCRDPRYRLREGDTRCGPDLYRRVAFLLLEQYKYEGALRLANVAIGTAAEAEARTRALLCRGIVQTYSADIPAAVEDLSAVLEFLPLGGRWPWVREMRSTYKSTAHQSLTRAFSFSDHPEHVRLGLALYPTIRKQWKTPEVDWTEAALKLKACDLGVIPEADVLSTRCDAVEMLEAAYPNLTSPFDKVGMITDLAAAYLPDLLRVSLVVASMTPPPELKADYERLLRARGVEDTSAALRRFRGAATELGAPPAVFRY